MRQVLSFCFKMYLYGVFIVTLSCFFTPIYFLLITGKKKETTFLFRTWSYVFRFFTCYFIRIKGQPVILPDPFIIIANHTSYLDIFLMYSVFPSTHFLFLGKSELLGYPLIKHFFKHLHIPVFRDKGVKSAKSLIKSRIALEEGWSLVIFPEGGISDENYPHCSSFKDGAFILAKQCQVRIVPITFLNNFSLFEDPSHKNSKARPGIAKVLIHPVISLDQINNLSLDELKDFAFSVIEKPLIIANKES